MVKWTGKSLHYIVTLKSTSVPLNLVWHFNRYVIFEFSDVYTIANKKLALTSILIDIL